MTENMCVRYSFLYRTTYVYIDCWKSLQMLEEEKEITVPRNRSLYLVSSVEYLHLSRIS